MRITYDTVSVVEITSPLSLDAETLASKAGGTNLQPDLWQSRDPSLEPNSQEEEVLDSEGFSEVFMMCDEGWLMADG